jgi:hypothetical protein
MKKRHLVPMMGGLLLIAASAAETTSATSGSDPLVPGLMATFRDDVHTASEVMMLPELGLNADESPHTAIKPAFAASFQGFLQVTQAGRYQFDTPGTLALNGEIVSGGRDLTAGHHAMTLTHTRAAGLLRFGLSWQSDSFVKEPVPPSAFWHKVTATTREKGNHPAPSHRIREALATMKCASCHDAVFLGTMHHKYQPDSMLTMIRHVNAPKWYGSLTGPVLPENEMLIQLAADLRKLPNGDRKRDTTGPDPNGARTMVGTQKGLACIACHDHMNHKAEAESKGPNLAFTTNRVTYDWFVRWMENPQRLKPGVPMPAFFIGLDAAERQQKMDALWDYLSLKERMEVPDELRLDPKQFILKAGSQPVFMRTYLRLPDGRELLRAICVGLPNGVSYCFDAETCQLAYVWTGGFLDMAPHWQNQSGMPTPAIGTPFHLPAVGEGLQTGDVKPSYRGYQIINGIPRFEFDVGSDHVLLLIDAPTPDSVTLSYTLGGRTQPLVYVGPPKESPVSMTSSHGTWTDHRLTIDSPGDAPWRLTLEKRK